VTLEELKDMRVQEIREQAEMDFAALFIEQPDDIPLLALEYVTMGALLGRNLAMQERGRFNDARALINRQRALCAQVRAATTEEEVLEVVWVG
jgi:hypothetical protein